MKTSAFIVAETDTTETETEPTPSPEEVVRQASLPTVASYIVTFLKPEMLHIYRQVSRLKRWRTVVFCQKHENSRRFPMRNVFVVPKPLTHQFRRFWQKTVKDEPITIYRSEARRLRKEIIECDARVLHVYFGHIGVHLLPLLEISPVPVIVSFHGADAQVDMDKPKHRAEMLRMLGLAKLLLVRSESLAERLVALGAAREKIRIHRTGIPLREIKFTQRVAPADGAWHCVQACRLIAKKGLTTTLRAFAEFSVRYPKATLTLAGSGLLMDELWRLVLKLGLQNRVKFTGFLTQQELRMLYDKSHLFLHPSEMGEDGDQEGVPNSMLEAMACGLPVIATNHGGIPEAVVHGVSGLLVPERDHLALAGEMLTLTSKPERYAAMSAEAAQRVENEFNLKVTVAALEGFYEEAAAD